MMQREVLCQVVDALEALHIPYDCRLLCLDLLGPAAYHP